MDEVPVPVTRREKFILDVVSMIRNSVSNIGAAGVYRALAESAWLHAEKNLGYRSAADPLANFHESPPVTKGLLSPMQYTYVLMAKQDDAVVRLIWAQKDSIVEYERRGGDAMLKERLLDGIVYRALLLAMLDADAPPRP